jgi:tight adherence protein C
MAVNPPPHGPTLLGFDVIYVGSILVGIAAAAMLLAIYAAITVRDPMAKRVKALNDRRDELKAGIVTVNAKKRQSIVRRNETTDNIRSFLESLKVLQDSQLNDIQQRLAQAGIRKKEWAVAVVLARMIGPIVLGILFGVLIYGVDYFPLWPSYKKFGLFAGAVLFGYKGPDIWIKNLINKRTKEIRKGLPDALDLLVICAEAGLTVDPHRR